MNPTQQKICEQLQKQPSASAGELAAILDMTAANIRHHLAILAQGGAIEATRQAPAGRGRPTLRYRLSPLAQANNLEELALALLAELLEGVPAADRPDTLRRLADRLLAVFAAGPPLPPAAASLTRRLSAAVQLLSACHYQARWEAHAGGPRLMLGHCPYAAILAAQPDLCALDARLLEQLLGRPARQIARQDPLTPACIFTIGAA